MGKLRKLIRILPKQKFYSNRLHRINAFVYIIIIYSFAALAAHYSYNLEMNTILQNNYNATNSIYSYYEKKHEEFWSVFSPAFQRKEYYEAVTQFLNIKDSNELHPQLRKKMVEMLNWSALQDTDIRWILLYRKRDQCGYVYNPQAENITEISERFPYISRLKEKNSIRKIYGTCTMSFNDKTIKVYGIAGDAYIRTENDSLGFLLAGYDLWPLEELYKRYTFRIPVQILIMTLDGEVIFDSDGKFYGLHYNELPVRNSEGRMKDRTGKQYFVKNIMKINHNYMVTCIASWDDLYRSANKNTWLIFGICTLFALLSTLLYIITGHLVSRRVNAISEGLKQIGRNNLQYRIPLADFTDEFGLIASNINKMSKEMEENIQKLYVYQLKQKTAELGELQSKINPHFLYNTLEVIRSQIQEAGNNEAGEMVMLLVRIFRSLINSKQFVTIQEEITFCNSYLELFKLRYHGRVNVVYDIENTVLKYGIIRNLLQPVIENFFVHGFDSLKEDNLVTISGHINNDQIVLVVEDNGIGISLSKLEQIRRNLDGESQPNSAGYGLINIDDRIKIFYGPTYSIDIQSRTGSGTIVRLCIAKMSCEQHLARMESMS